MKPLTDRDLETLDGFMQVSADRLKHGASEWMMPLDCGGSNGSHHSYTLSKLARRGYARMKKYGGPRHKGSCRYAPVIADEDMRRVDQVLTIYRRRLHAERIRTMTPGDLAASVAFLLRTHHEKMGTAISIKRAATTTNSQMVQVTFTPGEAGCAFNITITKARSR